MLILDDDRLDGMRCSKCRKYLSVFPVKNHPTSREVTCGRCSREDDGGVRSFLYELIAVEYLFRCVNRYEGCGKLLRVDETVAHERLCVGGTFPCPKCEDGVERSALDLTWHYKSEHPSNYLRRKNCFNVKPETDDVKLYVRDDVFAFISVQYGQDALRLAAATLTKMDVTQEFSVRRGMRLWERTERKPCETMSTFDADRFVLHIDPSMSVEVTFDLEASKDAVLYDVSVPTPSKAAIADVSNGKMFKVQTAVDIEGRFGYKVNDNGTALSNGDGDEISLICSNCKRLIGLPVYRCAAAKHQICGNCKVWCGICDNGNVQRLTSDDMLLTISKHLKFPCRWKCGAYITSNLHIHERSCESRMFKCPMCSFEVNWSSFKLIADHLEVVHGIFNFIGDYSYSKVIEFFDKNKKTQVSFVKNYKCCYLKWSQNDSDLYDFYFGVYGTEPNIQMIFLHCFNKTKYLNVIRGKDRLSWHFVPHIIFNHNKIVSFPLTASLVTPSNITFQSSPHGELNHSITFSTID